MIKYKISKIGQECLEKGIDIRPVRGTNLSAGMDLKASILEPLEIYPKETVKVFTGIHVFLGEILPSEDSPWFLEEDTPIQMAGLYLPRSSNKGLQLENTVGLLDCDFQGESFLKLYNKTDEVITIQPGERIAQLVIIPVIMDSWTEVDSFDEKTTRGEGGDGSTGKF